MSAKTPRLKLSQLSDRALGEMARKKRIEVANRKARRLLIQEARTGRRPRERSVGRCPSPIAF
jgi:hypothetical protein